MAYLVTYRWWENRSK